MLSGIGNFQKQQTAKEHRHTEHLPHGKSVKSDKTEVGIRFPEKFHNKAERAVPDKEQAANGHTWAWLCGKYPQKDEKNNTFKRGFIQLRRVPRQRSGTGKDHPYGRVSYPTPEFRVDEVAYSAEKKSRRNQGSHKVHGFKQGSAAPFRRVPHAKDHAEHPAMEGHAAVVQEKYFSGVAEKKLQIIEDNVSEPAAENNAEQPPGEEIFKLLGAENAIFSGAGSAEQPCSKKAKEVHEAIPSDGKGANG